MQSYASYASDGRKSKGRVCGEIPSSYRDDFARDRDRIMHSKAFRRLQYKTQIFINNNVDHYRNRMTHSIEVASMTRSICAAFGLNQDLGEAVALAHDLGHPPFGHMGELILDDCMSGHNGFSHNVYAFKILTFIEKRYNAYNGLNLTWEVLEGVVKHNGPLKKLDECPKIILEYDKKHNLMLDKNTCLESQIASLADDITYITHDIEDTINDGIITYDDLSQLEFINNFMHKLNDKNINPRVFVYELRRVITHHLVDSLLKQTNENIKLFNIQTIEDVRNSENMIVDFTSSIKKDIEQVKKMFFDKVYRHHTIIGRFDECSKIISELFALYKNNTKLLPKHWQEYISDEYPVVDVVSDYIAGMTDRFAISEHKRLCC